MTSEDDLTTQLEEAAETGDVERLNALLAESQNQVSPVKLTSTDLEYVLLRAVSANQVAAVACLLERGANVDPSIADAARRSKSAVDMYQIFLDHGWDCNVNVRGRPLLHLVLNNEILLKLLLENGADPNRKSDRWDSTSLDVAAGEGSVQAAKLLLQHGASITESNPLHSAASSSLEHDQRSMMAFLLDSGIDVNEISTFRRRNKRAGDENGTPLHAAIRSGFEDRISFLLSRGADPSVKTECGDTALDYARRWNFETGIKVLEARQDTKSE